MHRIRSLLMRDHIAQIDQIRGLLAEYGVVSAQTALKARQQLPAIIDDERGDIRSRRGHGKQTKHDFFVASRQFSVALVFFLTAGEIYSIGMMVGFPGGPEAR
jgi:hypothetical protein